MSLIAPERLARALVDVADTLVDDFDLIEFLQMVTTHASELVEAGAAGLLLADPHGRLQLMAASDERAEMIELFQVQAVQGPCQDCFRLGTAVVVDDLTLATERWPVFAPRAVESGYRSVHAFPLRLRKQVLGALNLFGDSTGSLDPADARVIQSLADIATIGLLQQQAIRRGEELSQQLQGALDSRIVIEQAKGALAQIHGVTPDSAFEMMRSYCRWNGLRLGDVASAITQYPDTVPELTSPRPTGP